jgi:ABC-type branched-subunit amino acid transport system substrate-binding protein
VLSASFAEVNRQGGLYNRRLCLCCRELPAGASRRTALHAFLTSKQVLAIAGGFVGHSGKDIAALAEEVRVPLVGVLSSPPPVPAKGQRYVFYLYAGLAEQFRILAAFACSGEAGRLRNLAVVSTPGAASAPLTAVVDEECRRQGAPAIQTLELVDEGGEQLASEVQRAGIDGLFLVAPNRETERFLTAIVRRKWFPSVFMPAALAGRAFAEGPPPARLPFYLAFPTLRRDHSPAVECEYEVLAKRHGLPQENRATQIAALASAKLLVEGLRRAGRDVSRESLVSALEGLSGWQTGLAPPLTFNPGRRIGAAGAYVVRSADKSGAFTLVGSWRELP